MVPAIVDDGSCYSSLVKRDIGSILSSFTPVRHRVHSFIRGNYACWRKGKRADSAVLRRQVPSAIAAKENKVEWSKYSPGELVPLT